MEEIEAEPLQIPEQEAGIAVTVAARGPNIFIVLLT